MHLIIDLILILIVAYCAFRGYKAGIIRGLCGILAIIVALYGANIVTSVYSSEFSGMLTPFVSGVVDSSVSKVLTGEDQDETKKAGKIISFLLRKDDDTEEETDETAEPRRVFIELQESEKEDVFAVSYATMRYFGLSDGPANNIAEKTAAQTSKVGQQMAVDLTSNLCDAMTEVILFMVAFIILAIVFAVIGNIIDLTFAVPGIEKVEPYVGIALGLVKGIIVIMVIGTFFRYAGILISNSTLEKTKLLSRLIAANPVSTKLGF
ncbi:MAG: hypothetical protein HUJ65_00400 [Oscillospiraceae bacterium]|nr:hypothetical protein [Oscillospiraceae bacterium]